MRKDCCPACDPTSHGQTDNPPGLDAIRFRCGTHASFLQAMLDRVSVSAHTGSGPNPSRPLDGLRTREPSDPAIAWLDAWATVAEILAFYQERLANEGYLRTAREERSVAELARLVGYRPRPGVSASCHLAFTLEQGHTVEIPTGTRVQSTPGPRELPQTFETSATIEARAAWSTMRARRTRPQHIPPGQSRNVVELYLKGLTLDLKPNDLLLLAHPLEGLPVVRRIESATPEPAVGRTRVKLQLDPISVVSLGTATWTALERRRAQGAFGGIAPPIVSRATTIKIGVETQDGALETTIRNTSLLKDLDSAVIEILKTYHGLSSESGSINELTEDFAPLGKAWGVLETGIKAARDKAKAKLEEDLGNGTSGLIGTFLEEDRLIKALRDELVAGGNLDNAKVAAKAIQDQILQPNRPLEASQGLVPAVAVAIAALSVSNPALDQVGSQFNTTQLQIDDAKQLTTEKLTTLATKVSGAASWDAQTTQLDDFLTSPEGMKTILDKAQPNAAPPTGHRTRLNGLVDALRQTDGVRKAIKDALQPFITAHPKANSLHPLIDHVHEKLSDVYEAGLQKAANDLNRPLGKAREAAEKLTEGLGDSKAQQLVNEVSAYEQACRDLRNSVTSLVAKLIQELWMIRVSAAELTNDLMTRYEDLPAGGVFGGVTGLHGWFKTAGVLDNSGKATDAPPEPSGLEQSKIELLLTEIEARLKEMQNGLNLVPADKRRLAEGLISEVSALRNQLGETREVGQRPTTPPPPELAGLLSVLGSVRPLVQRRGDAVSAAGVFQDILDELQNVGGRAPDLFARLAQAAEGKNGETIFAAWRGKQFHDPNACQIFAMRQKSALFGYNAPKVPVKDQPDPSLWPDPKFRPEVDLPNKLFLADALDRVLPGTYVVVQQAATETAARTRPNVFPIAAVTVRPRTDYGLSTRVTEIDIADGQNWYPREQAQQPDLSLLRTTIVYAQSELIELAQVPIRQEPGQKAEDSDEFRTGSLNYAVAADEIELDDLVAGLTIGREVLLQGERTDLNGVIEAEPKVIRAVTHAWREVDGDTPHTILKFDGPIGARRGTVAAAPISYKRDSVVVYGNVVRATHGETQREILGSGDARVSFQTFDLKVAPLTHLAAATVPGAEPVVEVRVDGVRWQRVDDLIQLGPHDRGYVVRIGDTQEAAVIFGDGWHGAKPPTGSANIQAAYRSGLGQAGNLGAGRVNELRDRPLGLKSVVNPLAASGGADREGRDQVRGNAPLGTRALGRLVAVEDYADFARSFAGIAKAAAVPLPGPRQPVIHVTIAGQDDAVILEDSDLYRNVLEAFSRLGNPQQPVVLQTRHQITLVLAASIRVAADYQWSSVEPRLRAALLAEFGFARRELGLAVTASEVLAALHAVPGVAYADLDVFGGIREFRNAAEAQEQFGRLRQQAASSQAAAPCVTVLPARYGHDGRYCAAEIAYLAAGFPELFLLTEVRT